MRNDDALLRLHASDNVVISKGDMQAGTEIPENGTLLNVTDAIPFGHKVATAAIAKDEAVKLALESERVQPHVGDKQVARTVYVPGKLVNIVVR